MANWIKKAIKHPGALHRALHVPEGQKIPAKKMAKASHSENPRVRRMVGLAKTLKHLHREDGGKVLKKFPELKAHHHGDEHARHELYGGLIKNRADRAPRH